MGKTDDFLNRAQTKEVYFSDFFNDVVFKIVPKKGIFTKLKGQEEFKAKDESKLVADALSDLHEITKEEYEQF